MRAASGWLRPCLTLAIAALPLCLSSCAPGLIRESHVERLPFSLGGGPEDGDVSASGRWARATTRQRSAIPTFNAVEILCSRSQRTCVEALAGPTAGWILSSVR